jgi:hypothetical protein
LIGEELYAASAYLGREPKQLGSIKGQDAFKGLMMVIIIVTLILGIVEIFTDGGLVSWLDRLVTSPAAG